MKSILYFIYILALINCKAVNEKYDQLSNNETENINANTCGSLQIINSDSLFITIDKISDEVKKIYDNATDSLGLHPITNIGCIQRKLCWCLIYNELESNVVLKSPDSSFESTEILILADETNYPDGSRITTSYLTSDTIYVYSVLSYIDDYDEKSAQYIIAGDSILSKYYLMEDRIMLEETDSIHFKVKQG